MFLFTTVYCYRFKRNIQKQACLKPVLFTSHHHCGDPERDWFASTLEVIKLSSVSVTIRASIVIAQQPVFLLDFCPRYQRLLFYQYWYNYIPQMLLLYQVLFLIFDHDSFLPSERLPEPKKNKTKHLRLTISLLE